MKKRRKGNLLQRMMAVLLSAVLIAGTAYGAFPVNALAQESISENTVELTEEETPADLNVEEPKGESAEEEIKLADPTENLSGGGKTITPDKSPQSRILGKKDLK